MMKKVLGVDFDDVLIDFSTSLSDFHNREHGTNYTRNDHVSWGLHNTWQCSPEEVVGRVLQFYHSSDHDDIAPVDGAQEALEQLKSEYGLVVVTSRPQGAEAPTRALLDKHYPNTFTDVIFTNQFGHNASESADKPITKGEVCRTHGMAAFVDDSFEHAQDVASHGIRSFLFDAPWNQECEHEGVERVFSWDEIVRELLQS